jgi:hypothetical protein
LTGDLGNEVEVRVTAQKREAALPSRPRDEQIGVLASPLTAEGQEPLYLTGSPHVIGCRLDQI